MWMGRGGGKRGRIGAVAVAAFVAALALFPAAAPAEGTLTVEQETLAARIDGELIAPCCYTQTVAVHDSQVAEEIRRQVRLLIVQGKGEGEILDTFVAQYGEEILASPRASGFNLLAYVFPALAVAVAMGVVALAVTRWRAGREAPTPVPVRPGAAPPAADPIRSRLEEELSRFDP